MKKRQLLAGLLALIMALALLPATALADEDPPLCDVYQGDGFYITVKPFAVKSTKYTLCKVNQNFYDGYVFVETADIDENYVNRRFVRELNLADKDGNIVLPEGRMHYSSAITTYLTSGRYAPSEGLVPFWDGNSSELMGFMDYQGNVVIPCQFDKNYIQPFHDGLAVVGNRIVIDKTGREAFSYREKGISSLMADHYDQGLIPATKFNPTSQTYGYIDGQGNMVLPLVTVPDGTQDRWQGYADGTVEGYLMPYYGSRFSDDGYAVVQDLRSGDKLAYAYAIIDTSGNVVGTFRDMEPQDSWASGGFHDGLLRVAFIDNRGQTDGYAFVGPSGSVVWREDKYEEGHLRAGANLVDYHSGLLTLIWGGVADTKGQIVIPQSTFSEMRDFHDGLALAFLNGQTYVLEKHEGVYTGPGKVYNHAKGGVQTSTPAQPETPAQPSQPSDEQPAGWAREGVTAAVNAGIVPANLQSGYSKPTTRAEFCALAVALYETVTGKEVEGRTAFSDTSDVNVEKAAYLGVVSGTGGGGFDPEGALTREQAAAMLSRLAEAAGRPLAGQTPTFADSGSIAGWAVAAVGQMQASGVMGGIGDNQFSPQGSYSREQSIVTMQRLYDLLK